jgi:hypothetical protein
MEVNEAADGLGVALLGVDQQILQAADTPCLLSELAYSSWGRRVASGSEMQAGIAASLAELSQFTALPHQPSSLVSWPASWYYRTLAELCPASGVTQR